MTTIEKVTEIVFKVQDMLKDGKSLQEIQKWSYLARESGDDIFYFSIGTKSAADTETYIEPAPLTKQKEYYSFFTEKSKNAIALNRYVLRIYADGFIEFADRPLYIKGEKPISYSLLK